MAYSPFGNAGFRGSPFGASSGGLGGSSFGAAGSSVAPPLSFTDPLLSASFKDPLRAADLSNFQYFPSTISIERNIGPMGLDGFPVRNPAYWEHNGRRYNSVDEFEDDRQKRAARLLSDPQSAPYFDLPAHLDYPRMREEWYADRPTDNFLKYFPRASSLMSGLDSQYRMNSPNYLSPDFFAHALYKQSPPAGLPGPLERANYIRKAWEDQPLLAGRNLDLSNQNIGGVGDWTWNTIADAERPYIQEEFEEAASDDGFGGFLGKLLKVAGPILSFIPGPWQPFGLALNMINSVASGNPLGALMSLGGAALGSALGGGFGGGGDFLGDLAASDFANFGVEGVGALGNSLGYSAGIDWAPLSTWSGGTAGALANLGGTDFGLNYLSDLAASDFANFGVQGVDALGNSLGYSSGIDYSAPTAEGFQLPEGAKKALGRGALRGALRALQPQQQVRANAQRRVRNPEEERRRRRRLPPGVMGHI